MIRSAMWLSLALSLASPALAATDDTDTDTDTDTAVVATNPGQYTAAELAGEEGGVDCSHVGSVGAASPALLLGLLALARRRR